MIILTVTDVLPTNPDVYGFKARADLHLQTLDQASWFRIPYPGKSIHLTFCFVFFYRSSSALQCRSSTEILPDYWGTFCAWVNPVSFFSFLVAAGFEPTSLSLPSRRINRYPILTPNFNYRPLARHTGLGLHIQVHVFIEVITTYALANPAGLETPSLPQLYMRVTSKLGELVA